MRIFFLKICFIFLGDYGDYLKLLEGNSALGFNPQADPIGDNQVKIPTYQVGKS